MTYTPVNDETICYSFEYNNAFKIKRWTRFRGWNFACGCVTQKGRTLFAKEMKVYLLVIATKNITLTMLAITISLVGPTIHSTLSAPVCWKAANHMNVSAHM